MMDEAPTIAEEHFARLIAYWHGQRLLYIRPERGSVTVAGSRGYDSGWAWETDRYVNNHWQEYVSAARVVLAQR